MSLEPKAKKQKIHHESAVLTIEELNLSEKEFEDYYTALHLACQQNNEAEVNNLLQIQQVDIEEIEIACWNNGTESPLCLAAENGNLAIVQQLIAHGAEELHSALCAACSGGHVHIVKYLLSLEHKIEEKPYYSPEERVLWSAMESGSLEIVQLIAAEEHYCETAYNRCMMVVAALERDFDDIAEYLLPDAFYEEPDPEDLSQVLAVALARGKKQMVEKFHRYLQLDELDEWKYDENISTNLVCSAIEGDLDYSRYYTQSCVDIADVLCTAAERGRLDIFYKVFEDAQIQRYEHLLEEPDDYLLHFFAQGNLGMLDYIHGRLPDYEPPLNRYFEMCAEATLDTRTFGELYSWAIAWRESHRDQAAPYSAGPSYIMDMGLTAALKHNRTDIVRMLYTSFGVPIFDCLKSPELQSPNPSPYIIQMATHRGATAVARLCQHLLQERTLLRLNKRYRDVIIYLSSG